MTVEDEDFNRIERESAIRKEYIREMQRKPIGLTAPVRDPRAKAGVQPQERIAQLTAEIAILNELVRVLSDRVRELEGNTNDS